MLYNNNLSVNNPNNKFFYDEDNKYNYNTNNLETVNDGIAYLKEQKTNTNNNNNNLIKNKTKNIRLVVNKYKTSKIITEKDLINDLIYVFQGIDGNYINFSANNNSYQLNPIIPFNENVVDIVDHLTELGWLYKKTKSLLDYLHDLNSQSQILQAFVYAVQYELNYHYK
jgi:hypothetical protein